jgi:hypothetical protein
LGLQIHFHPDRGVSHRLTILENQIIIIMLSISIIIASID